MDSFPDRAHVWLWSREHGKYLYAREDGEGIAWRAARGTLHGAWAVHRQVRDGIEYVLFQSCSYGRYLALNEDPRQEEDDAEDEYYVPAQCTYDSPDQENLLFQARRDEESDDLLIISHPTHGDWCRLSPNDVDETLHWVVEVIPTRLLPPDLPVPPQPIPPPPVPSRRLVPVGVGGPIRRRPRSVHAVQPEPMLHRRINFVVADNQGNFNPAQWDALHFDGCSVFNLRRDLGQELGEANVEALTLCTWAGVNGILTPLVIDLPSDEKTMHIVVLTTGSPAAQALVYPNVDAQ